MWSCGAFSHPANFYSIGGWLLKSGIRCLWKQSRWESEVCRNRRCESVLWTEMTALSLPVSTVLELRCMSRKWPKVQPLSRMMNTTHVGHILSPCILPSLMSVLLDCPINWKLTSRFCGSSVQIALLWSLLSWSIVSAKDVVTVRINKFYAFDNERRKNGCTMR